MKRGGCKGLFSLRENISDSVFVGLNSTNQVAAQCDSLSKSVLRQAAAITGFSTIIERLENVSLEFMIQIRQLVSM